MLLLYVLPLFAPPAGMAPMAPGPEAGIWQRVFPGVPAWWVLGRLACLFCGAALIAWSTRGRLPLRLGGATGDDPTTGTRATRWIALILASGHAFAGLFAAQLGRRGEIAYFLFLAVPMIVVACGEIDRIRRMRRLAARRLTVLLIMPVLWLALCAPMAWRSPRAASLIDMWIFIDRLEQVALGNQRILADTTGPGHTNAYMMLEGAWLFGPERLPSFAGLQVTHTVLGILCALVVGAAAWLMVGRAAAIVAQAALLFSPYGLSSLYELAPMFFTSLCVASMLLLVLLVRRFRSEAALAAAGVVAGISTTDPPATAAVLVLCMLAYSLWKFPRFPWLAAGVAILSGAAAIVPSLPTPATFVEMAQQYTFGRIELAGIVRILFGQETPFAVGEVFKAGQPGPLDLPIGALLTPFAIARTPMRLWGDVLFDPVGTALFAIGLALCLRHGLRHRAAILLGVLLGIQLLQGFAATGDAVSHTRLAPALVPMALLSGLAFETLRRSFADPWHPLGPTIATVAAIALSGILIFTRVTPAILPASSLAISLDALGTWDPNADAVFLEHDPPRAPKPGDPITLRWLYVAPIARLLPSRPLPTRTASQLPHEELSAAGPLPRLYLWSPALQQDANVSKTICGRWPGAALYTLFDEPKLYRALAAAPGGDHWRPRLATDRWTVAPCPPET